VSTQGVVGLYYSSTKHTKLTENINIYKNFFLPVYNDDTDWYRQVAADLSKRMRQDRVTSWLQQRSVEQFATINKQEKNEQTPSQTRGSGERCISPPADLVILALKNDIWWQQF